MSATVSTGITKKEVCKNGCQFYLTKKDMSKFRRGIPQRRCERLSGNLVALQKYIDNFQAQSATLILNGFPGIEDILAFFELQHLHAWGSLKQLEDGNYKVFCDTTYILYKEFLDKFPQYRTEFPERCNASILKEWKI